MLAYTDIGKGVPMLFIHGLGSKKEAWEPQHELSTSYRLIIPDLRGHGETKINQKLTIRYFAKDLIELLKFLDIPSAYICGLSLGGIVAQELYRQEPDMVKGLILANTTSYIPIYFGYAAVAQAKADLRNGVLADKIAFMAVYNKTYVDDAKKAFNIRDTYLEASQSAIGLNYFMHLYFIKKPVLLIGSSHDRVTPSFNVHLMSMCLRKCESVIFNRAGHLSNIEKKAEFNDAVLSFMNKNERVRGTGSLTQFTGRSNKHLAKS